MTKKKRQKVATPVKPLIAQERRYRIELMKLGRLLAKSIRAEVLPFIKAHEQEYVLDGVGSNLEIIFGKLNTRFSGIISAGFASSTATQMVTKVTKTNKKKFDASIERAMGVDLGAILQAEGLVDFMETSINRNVSLIKSLPSEYLKSVETIVTNGVTSGARYSTIANQILGKVGTANSHLSGRIKTIAMNEIQTINSQLNLRRSDALGITEGYWRTGEDEKVRGNPSGKYPTAKPSHYKLNGVRFNLKKGAKTEVGTHIKPGEEINCRCSYSPIIDLDAL